jgi:hypothetical protein
MLARLVPIDDASCSRRLDFRSWKKVFQSSMAAGLDDVDVDAVVVGRVDVDGDSEVLVGWETVEAYLTSCLEECENGEDVLMALLLAEVFLGSWDRRGEGAAVWYELGVESDGCRRQPIAAVRSDSSVRNIILCVDVVLVSRLSQNNVMQV